MADEVPVAFVYAVEGPYEVGIHWVVDTQGNTGEHDPEEEAGVQAEDTRYHCEDDAAVGGRGQAGDRVQDYARMEVEVVDLSPLEVILQEQPRLVAD